MRATELQDEAFPAALTASMSALHRRFHGRPPEHAHSLVLSPDLVASVMGDDRDGVEDVLDALARGLDVDGPRSVFQDAMEWEMVASVERMSGRPVHRFISNSRLVPRVEIERFYLGPAAGDRRSDLSPIDPAPAADMRAAQRTRILAAARSLAIDGRRRPAADEIAAYARASLEDLYMHFDTLEACLDAALPPDDGPT